MNKERADNNGVQAELESNDPAQPVIEPVLQFGHTVLEPLESAEQSIGVF
jgi:hypothetical protein